MISADELRKERDGLTEQLQQTVATVHQLRGAIHVLNTLIARDEDAEGTADVRHT